MHANTGNRFIHRDEVSRYKEKKSKKVGLTAHRISEVGGTGGA